MLRLPLPWQLLNKWSAPKCKNSEGHNKNNFCFSGLVATKQFRFAAAFASLPSTELVGTCQHNKTKQEPAIIVHHFPRFKKTQNVQMWKLDELDEIAMENDKETWWNMLCHMLSPHPPHTQDPQHLHPTREEHATDTQRNQLRDRCYLLLLHGFTHSQFH